MIAAFLLLTTACTLAELSSVVGVLDVLTQPVETPEESCKTSGGVLVELKGEAYCAAKM